MSLTPSIYLDIIEKHSTLGENQFTEKPLKKDLGVPSIEAYDIDELTDSN